MKWSLNLGRLAGIKVLVHWTFLILIGWVVITELNKGSDWNTIWLTIGYVLAIFACVVLHELGHALMARRYGIGTRKITLLPIGGVASLEKMPEKPKRELLVAVAGPAVNIVIALLLYPIVAPLNQYIPGSEEEIATSITPENFLFSLFAVNVLLVLFNAIPAFPMDGGRALRAILSMNMDRLKATNVAARLGQLLAIGFVFLGFFANPFLIFIGIFVFLGANSENMIIQQLEYARGHKVQEAMITSYEVLAPEDTIEEATKKLIAGSDTAFIVAEDGKVAGIITRKDIIEALSEKQKGMSVSQIMNRDFLSFNAKDKLKDALFELRKTKQGIFPVLEEEKIKGLITPENVNEFIMIQSALD